LTGRCRNHRSHVRIRHEAGRLDNAFAAHSAVRTRASRLRGTQPRSLGPESSVTSCRPQERSRPSRRLEPGSRRGDAACAVRRPRRCRAAAAMATSRRAHHCRAGSSRAVGRHRATVPCRSRLDAIAITGTVATGGTSGALLDRDAAARAIGEAREGRRDIAVSRISIGRRTQLATRTNRDP